MSYDPYNDFTDEEKALLKREMQHRIASQRARENALKNLPRTIMLSSIIGATLWCAILGLLVLPMPDSPSFGLVEKVASVLLFSLPFGVMFLLGLLFWIRQRYKAASHKSKRG